MKKEKLCKILSKVVNFKYSVQADIDQKVQEIAILEKEIQDKAKTLGADKLCQKCAGRCCSYIILEGLEDNIELSYYVAKMNPDFEDLIMNNDSVKRKCLLLSEEGCLLRLNGRPRICVSYFCDVKYKIKIIDLRKKLTESFLELKGLLLR